MNALFQSKLETHALACLVGVTSGLFLDSVSEVERENFSARGVMDHHSLSQISFPTLNSKAKTCLYCRLFQL